MGDLRLLPGQRHIFERAVAQAPLLDLQDFIQALRAKVGPQCSLIVVPVGADGEITSEAQRSIWSRWTARVGDPALYLESGA